MFLDVYVQLEAPGVPETWKTIVAQNVPSNPTWFLWKPTGLVDGSYKLRFVPDGKETFNVPANKLPCFASGESIPFVTAEFRITNPSGNLGSYPDPYAPNGTSTLRKRIFFCMRFALTAAILLLWLSDNL